MTLVSLSCRKENTYPEILTQPLIPLEDTSYLATTLVLNKGDYKIKDHGFFYGTGYISPGQGIQLLDEFKISLGERIDKDTFSYIISPAINKYQFYEELRCFVRGFVTDERGTVYGNYTDYPILKLEALYIVPAMAHAGDTVMIVGFSFNLEPELNMVTFNGTNAYSIDANQYRLFVRVPDGIVKNDWPYIVVKIRSRGQEVELNSAFQLLD